jgi:hypothetical protein
LVAVVEVEEVTDKEEEDIATSRAGNSKILNFSRVVSRSGSHTSRPAFVLLAKEERKMCEEVGIFKAIGGLGLNFFDSKRMVIINTFDFADCSLLL